MRKINTYRISITKSETCEIKVFAHSRREAVDNVKKHIREGYDIKKLKPHVSYRVK